MLSELLLVLGGHPSAFFTASPATSPTTLALAPALATLLHPGEVVALGALAQLAFDHAKVRTWATTTQARGRRAVLESAVAAKGKQRETADADGAPGVYLATLASAVLDVLGDYDLLLVETEAAVLRLDPGVVQDGSGFVPLATLLATFDPWQAPLASLAALVDTLSDGREPWTPGRMLHELYERTQTGHPRLHDIYTAILAPLQRLFLTHLTAFILTGLAPAASTPTSPAVGLDTGPDPLSPKHRIYALDHALFPPSVSARTKESVLYVGRVAATLKREGRDLPRSLVDSAREEIMAVRGLDDSGGLDEAVQRARAEVGEWLWKHILTGSQVIDAINAFGDYFLTRNAEYALSVLRELGRLRVVKLLTNPTSSTSVIREQDVNLALLRASVGTAAESDRALERLRWRMPRGPLRATGRERGAAASAAAQPASSATRDLFSSQVLGTPLELTTTVSWPLDLFMTAPAVAAYADMHAYLFALRDTHARVLDCWTALSASQRRRRRFTGASEGGTADEARQRRALARQAWATVRAMLFFLDQLQSHFMTDIIDVQHRRLLEQLGAAAGGHALRPSGSVSGLAASLRSHRALSPSASRRASTSTLPAAGNVSPHTPSSPAFDAQTVHTAHTAHSAHSAHTTRSRFAPPTPRGSVGHAAYLDFLTLRQVHARHLAFLRDGLLLSEPATAGAVRDVLAVCTRLAGLVERWGGDVVPELLAEGDAGALLAERARAVAEIDENLRDLLADFFRALVELQDPHAASDAAAPDAAGAGADASLGRSRVPSRRNVSVAASRALSSTFGALGRRLPSAAVPPPGAGAGAGARAGREADERALEAEAVMGRHIEQLLLRLDFNGVLSQWLEADGAVPADADVLAEGGLA